MHMKAPVVHDMRLSHSHLMINLCSYSKWDVKLKVFIMVVTSDWHITFERESVRMPDSDGGFAGMCVHVFCVCVSETDRDVKSSKRTMRLVQGWTLGDGDRQRDGVIGGRRWQGTKGQWVKLFVSPPAPSPSEKLQIKQMTLQVKRLVKMQSMNTLSGAINSEVFCIWFVCVHIALFWMK